MSSDTPTSSTQAGPSSTGATTQTVSGTAPRQALRQSSDGTVRPLRTQSQLSDRVYVSNSGSDWRDKVNPAAVGHPTDDPVSKPSQELRFGRSPKKSRDVASREAPFERRDTPRVVLHPDIERLRPYQREGVEFLTTHQGAVLGDAMGTGKTPQASCAAALVCNNLHKWNVYIITTKLNLLTWQSEIAKWIPGAQVYTHAGAKRDRNQIPRANHFVITNFGLEQELPAGCTVLIIDESHKAKNRQTQRYKALKGLSKAALYVWLLSGTVVRNHPADLIPQAMLCRVVKAYWPCVEQWFATTKAEYGSSQEIGSVKNIPAFKAWASTFMLRRTKKQALPDLPAKTRRRLLVKLTVKQQKVYDELVKELASVIDTAQGEELLIASTKLALTTRLRQLLVTPQLLGSTERGSAMEAVSLWVRDVVVEEKQKGVIFTPFRKAIPFIVEASGVPADKVSIFTGGMSVEKMAAAKARFDGEGSLAICTIQVSEGFSLTNGHRVLFAGADWTMAANEQAEDRCHRFGQETAVGVDYITHLGTIEEDLFALLDTKHSHGTMFDNLKGLLA